eukprot:g5474.t1
MVAIRCGSGGSPSWRWHEDGSNFLKAIMLWGPSLTFKKFMSMKDLKFGNKIGEDSQGNSYYENLDYQYGRHRWVEYKDYPWSSEIQATNVDADWFGWLHYTTDQPGNDFRLQKGGAINQGSDVPYDTNLGGVIEPFERNMTGTKYRAYGDGVSPEEDHYWKQPSNPTYKKGNSGPVFHRERVEEWVPEGEVKEELDPKNQPAGFTTGGKFTRNLNDY